MRPALRALLGLGGLLLLPTPAHADETSRFTLAGRASRADGTPLEGRVVVTPTLPAAPAREATLDADGRFAVEGLGRATVTVEVRDPAGLTLREDGIGLPHAKPLSLRVPADLRVLSGVVRDAAGRAVAGATVRSWASVGPGEIVDATTTTATDGAFALRVHPEGWLRVDAAGFSTSQRLVFLARSPFAVRLSRSGTVSGHVRRAEGTPVAGTTLWARPMPLDPGNPIASMPRAASVVGTTAADGTFGPLPLERGRWLLFALGAGAASRELMAAPTRANGVLVEAVPGVDRAVELVALHAASLAGIVCDDAGRRVAGAEVVAGAPAPAGGSASMFGAPDEPAGPAATTDAQGRFTLDGLVPDRPVALVARRSGVAGPVLQGIVPTREASAPLSLTVPVLRRLEVRLVDDAGRPVPGAAVSVLGGDAWRTGATGDDGRVVLGEVPAGGVSIAARPFGAVAATETKVAVPGEGEVPILDVRVERGAAIAGRVHVREGPTPTGLTVTVLGPLEAGRIPPQAGRDGVVRADGTFVVAGLAPGRYQVVAGTHQAAPVLEGRAEAEAGANDLEIAIEPTRDGRGDVETPTYEVRVVDPDGSPVPLASGTAQEERGGTLAFDVEAGSAVLAVASSAVRIRVRFALDALGRPVPLGPADVRVVPKAGDVVTIALPRERTITGRLLGPDGRPAAGIEVRAQVPGPDPFTAFGAQDVPASVARTDADGRFVLGQLGDGTYDVEAPASPGVLATSLPSVRAGAREVRLARRRAVDVTVHVEDASGRPVQGATVRWTAPTPAPDPDRPAAPVLPWAYDPPERTTDANGRARLLGLDPDVPLRLDVWPPRERGDVRAAALDAWSPADVTVRLPFGLSIRGVVRDRGGRPVPWAQVYGQRGDDRIGFDEVDSEGRFAFDGLAPGLVDVTASVLGVRDAGMPDARARVEAGAQDVVLVVDPGPTLVVHADGRRFPGVDDAHRVGGGWTEARLIEEGPDGGETYGHVEDGALVFRRLRPGRPYTLWIPWTKEAGGTFLETGTSLAVGERTIELEPGAPIRGSIDRTRVRPYSYTGSGPARETVAAFRGRVRVRGAMTPEGDIEFAPLPAGRWRIEAHVVDGAGTGRYEASVEADAGATIQLTPVRSAPR